MILVTGGAGYIGSHAVLALRERGFDVLILDNFSRGHRDLLFSEHWWEGDILDYEGLCALFEHYPVEAVLHFAAKSLVGESMDNPETYYLNNVQGTLTLLRAMKKYQVNKVVFSSSASVYGDPVDIPLTEKSRLSPTSVYGETKLFIESMLRRYFEAYGISSISLRYFNAAGADFAARTGEDHTPETHLIPLLLEVAMGHREEIHIFGNDYPTPDGTCVRDYVHVSDLATAHVLAVEKLLSSSPLCGAYNLGNEKGSSVLEVLSTVEKVTEKKIRANFTKRRQGDPAILIASSARAREELGWIPELENLEEIVKTAWQWHKKRFAR